MSSQSTQTGITEQDRTLSDLLESYRHLQADPTVEDERKQKAAERMEPVWANLAKLQDPDGFVNHISEVIQREFQRRHEADGNPNLTRRGKPLCRCERPRHVCEVKQGEVPSKIRTQNLQYIQKPSSRTLAREYIQEHSGDVVVREAMEGYRNLRADIYAQLSQILAMMMGDAPLDVAGSSDGADGVQNGADDGSAQSPSDGAEATDTATANADGEVDAGGDA
jgi:hypothetical protein